MSNTFAQLLTTTPNLHVQQLHEGWEILGIETRNKYRILNANMEPVAYAAEISTGFLGTLLRLLLKHWRSFEIHLFDHDRRLLYRARFPFRWFFKSLFLEDASGRKLGELRQRFGLFYKKFDLLDSREQLIATIRSPLFRIWTFEVKSGQRRLGAIEKKWSGALTEIFTDKDNFVVSFEESLEADQRAFLLATTLMIDIVYFENNRSVSLMDLAD